MEHITTTVLLSLILVLSSAQAQYPFPDSAASWHQTYRFMVTPPPIPTFLVQATANVQVNGDDTLINSTSYTKLTDAVNGMYYGSIRDDGGQVWIVPVDSTQEYLLYDFTANAGDTLTDVAVYQGFPQFYGPIRFHIWKI